MQLASERNLVFEMSFSLVNCLEITLYVFFFRENTIPSLQALLLQLLGKRAEVMLQPLQTEVSYV